MLDVCTSGRLCDALLSSSGCEHFLKVFAVMCVHRMTPESVKPRHSDIYAVIGVYCMIICLIHMLCAAVHDVIWIEIIEKSRGLRISFSCVFMWEGSECAHAHVRSCVFVCMRAHAAEGFMCICMG